MEPVKTTTYTGPYRASAPYGRTPVTAVPHNEATPSSHHQEHHEGAADPHCGKGEPDGEARQDAGPKDGRPPPPQHRAADEEVVERLARGFLGEAGVFIDRKL